MKSSSMKNLFKELNVNQKGSGMIGIILISAVILTLMVTLSQYSLSSQKVHKYYSLKSYKEAFKNLIRGSMDCGKTIKNIDPDLRACNIGQRLEVSKMDDSILLQASGPYAKIGSFQFRAECRQCQDCWAIRKNEIGIYFRLVDKNNNPVEHPVYGDTRWFSLFEDGELKCQFSMY